MTADPQRATPARSRFPQARVTMAQLGAVRSSPRVPTTAEYLPQVIAAPGPGAVRTYGTY